MARGRKYNDKWKESILDSEIDQNLKQFSIKMIFSNFLYEKNLEIDFVVDLCKQTHSHA